MTVHIMIFLFELQTAAEETKGAPKLATVKPKKAAVSVKTATANLVVHTQFSTSPLEEISDLFDHLPLEACVEQTHWLLTSVSSLPTWAARPRAVLNMAPRPRSTEGGKAPHLACWNADGVRGRKLELEHFLNQHGVDVYLLSETFLNPGQAFRLAKYVCHRTDRQPYWAAVVQSNTQCLFRA